MMSEDLSTAPARWGEAVEAFNRDDLDPLAAMLDETCTFSSSLGLVGSSGPEVIERLRAARGAGWLRHDPLALVMGGEFMVATFRNHYADGSSFVGAGILRFGPSGRVTEIRTLEPQEAATTQARQATTGG